MTPAKDLKGDALANAVADAHAHFGNVWAHYGNGWITLRGEGLESHPDLKANHPNGWSLCHTWRSSEARRKLPGWRAENRLKLKYKHNIEVGEETPEGIEIIFRPSKNIANDVLTPYFGRIAINEDRESAWIEAEKILIRQGHLG